MKNKHHPKCSHYNPDDANRDFSDMVKLGPVAEFYLLEKVS